jgi:xanthine dehydrogenase large subunit
MTSKLTEHIDARMHVCGTSQYVDDVPPPADMLHAQIFDSPVAHGRIRSLDTAPALAVDGVVSVLTADDIPGSNLFGPIIQDEKLLVDDTVEFIGHPIAIVVASSYEQARRAVRAIQVEIDELPAIVDPREAFEKGLVLDEPRTFELGNVDSEWDECECVVEGECDIGGQEHLYLETNRARAIPGEDGTVKIFSSTQSPYGVQRSAAAILGVPYHKVEVDVVRLGGGFGGKEDQATHWACMAALAACHLNRSVEVVLGRMDDIRMTGKRHPYKCDFKLGLSSDGRMVALEIKHFQNSGAFTDLSTAVLERTLFHSTNAYAVPNARIMAVPCKTNLTPHTAFRGFGGPQGMFVIESALAKAAEALDMPREQIQRMNLIEDGDVFPYGQVTEDARAVRTWEEAADAYDLPGLRASVQEYNAGHFETKMGLAVMPVCFGISFTKTFLNQASALVHVYGDGSVSVSNGGVEMGQGNSTKIHNLVARTFGIGAGRVRSESTNTRRVANMSPSAASATSDLNGYATLSAVEQIMARLRAFAAKELEADEGAIAVREEQVTIDGRDSGWTWAHLISQAYMNRIGLSAHGFYATPDIHFDRDTEKGHPFFYHVYGTAIIQVKLDVLRGVYDLVKIGVVHDLGRAINEIVDLGQVEGGLAQGLGWMSMEDLQFDEKGRYLSNTLSTYKIPDVYFMPDDFEVRFLDDADNPRGPHGSKAVGEPPLMYGIGLFFAVRDAMRAARPDADLDFASPITPERVLLQLHSDELQELKAQCGTPRGSTAESILRSALD